MPVYPQTYGSYNKTIYNARFACGYENNRT
jgi:hypothetical protein